MQETKKPHTHTAYSFKRLGKKHGRLLECGTGRIDAERNVVHVFLDRTPIGGWTGYVVLSPHGVQPEPPPARPQRPGEDAADDEESED